MSTDTKPTLTRYPSSPRGLAVALAAAALIGGGTGTALLQTTHQAQATEATTSPALMQQALPPQSFSQIADAVMPTVVRVEVEREAGGGHPHHGQPLPPGMRHYFEEFFNPGYSMDRGPRGKRHRHHHHRGPGIGSGFIVDPDGFIVTNHHVVAGAETITVTLHDGQDLEAALVGSDPKTDLALLKVSTDGPLPAASFAASEAAKVGDWVIAVGNPFGLGGTVTAGVISARGRDIGAGPYDDFLQIDASINRGNSGGPTFNLAGQVVGVNTAILAPAGGNIGIGFAIPAGLTRDVIEDLKDDGQVTRGWLGVRVQPVDDDIAAAVGLDDASGAMVSDFMRKAPAAESLVAGDIILAVDGTKIGGPKELSRLIADLDPGAAVEMDILRNGDRLAVSVILGDQAKAFAARKAGRKGWGKEFARAFGLALADTPGGVRVKAVNPNGPAAEKGMRRGDRILAVGTEQVENLKSVRDAVASAVEGGQEALLVKVARGQRERFVALPLPEA